MNHENNSSNDGNDPKNRINLDLSLWTGPQEQDPMEEQNPVEDEVQNKQFSRSVSHDLPPNTQPSPPPPHDMTPHVYYNNVINVSGMNLLQSPPLGAARPQFLWSFPPPGQFLRPPQATHGGAGDLETPRRGTRLVRRNSSRVGAVERNVGGEEIVPPYPWATTRPGIIYDLTYLLTNNINVIYGQVHCKPCENTLTLEYNLMEKFEELERYIKENKEVMRERAPDVWLNPKLVPCGTCQSGMKPVISVDKEKINWLFLLLGQMLGCCTLDQLRHFCEKISKHRTGSKDRVLYITYVGLCMQLKHCDTFNLRL